MRIVDREEDLLDGDAIYIAGRNLDFIAGKNIFTAFGMKTTYADVEALIKNNLLLLDTLLCNLTTRQSDVLYYKLMGYSEMKISRMLGISQAAVNLRARNAGWQQIKATLKVLENINYGEYVD
jgi:DNA-directed RNA polymerase specialized sigma24 family protein